MTMRLLYNVNIPRFFVTHRLPLALAAREAGYDVHVTTSDGDQESIAKIHAAGLPFHPLPLAQHGMNPLGEARALQAMIRLYRKLQPDIVHHVSIKPVLYGGVAAHLTGVKAVVGAMSGLGRAFTENELKMRVIRQIAKPVYRLVFAPNNTRMIFQNPDDMRLFIDMGLLPQIKAVLIRGSGVDVDVFRPQPEPNNNVPVILFAGRLMWRKGVGEFVEAAKQLRGKARFQIAGFAEATSSDTVPTKQLQAWAEDGLIEWLGKRDDMPTVFAQSNIVCLPSTYGEGVPKVLIEAAACARPIVTTDTPGCREICLNGENGYLVPPYDTRALVNALARLIDHPNERERMGQVGRQLVIDKFALQRVIDDTLALYETLLRSPISTA